MKQSAPERKSDAIFFCSLLSIESICKMLPVWHSPQCVEKVHTLCASKPASNDQEDIYETLNVTIALIIYHIW